MLINRQYNPANKFVVCLIYNVRNAIIKLPKIIRILWIDVIEF